MLGESAGVERNRERRGDHEPRQCEGTPGARLSRDVSTGSFPEITSSTGRIVGAPWFERRSERRSRSLHRRGLPKFSAYAENFGRPVRLRIFQYDERGRGNASGVVKAVLRFEPPANRFGQG